TCPGTLANAPGVNSSGCDWYQQLNTNVTANPARPTQCSSAFSIVIDRSGSFNEQDAGTATNAAKNFAQAILGADPTATFRIVGFGGGTADVELPGPSSDLATIQTAIQNASDNGNSYTNWAAGITAGYTPGIEWEIVITDGNPNRPGTSGSAVHFAALESARDAANAVKGAGVHISVVGVDTSGNAPAGFGPVSESYATLVGGSDVTVGAIGGLDAILQQIASSCTPSFQKVKINPPSVYTPGGNAQWEIKVFNPTASLRTYTIVDPGATFVVGSAAGGTCSDTTFGDQNGGTCQVNANATLVFKVEKPWPAKNCSAQTLNNEAFLSGNGLTSFKIGGTAASQYDIPADPQLPSCLGTIVVHKEEQGSLATTSGDNWTFDLSGAATDSKSRQDSGTVTFSGLTPGSYSVTEQGATGSACSPTSPSGSFETHHGVGDNSGVATTLGAIEGPLSVAANQTIDVWFTNKPCVLPNVSVSKTAGQSPVLVGSNVTFQVTVTNAGPGQATGVTFTDALSTKANWSLASAVPGCTVSGTAFTDQKLTCTFATMDVGSKIIDLVGATRLTPAPNSCGIVLNPAFTVSATNEADGQSGDNTTTEVSVTVQCPGLAVVKSGNPASADLGSQVGFDIVVTNNGDGTANNVQVTDALPAPAGMTWASTTVVGGGGSCTITAGGALDCTITILAAGDAKTIQVRADTAGTSNRDICGVHTNPYARATVSGVNSDSGPANVTVNCPAITIAKVANPAGSVNSGSNIGWTFTVTNTTSVTATNVAVGDTLPSANGLVWLSTATTTSPQG
ncbi:MAG: VWA domain-containing protein, partial [Tepidiformaceae bacterium]